jgi:four helix bundle protein
VRYDRFEDLPVWKTSTQLALDLFDLVDDKGFNFKGDLRSQLQRAALSIQLNIAEGFERGTTSELITFLYIARGSAGEVRSGLHFAHELPSLSHLKSRISNMISVCESVSRQLRGFADTLQNSDIKGQRYLTDDAKDRMQRQRGLDEFLEMTRRIVDEARRDREARKERAASPDEPEG